VISKLNGKMRELVGQNKRKRPGFPCEYGKEEPGATWVISVNLQQMDNAAESRVNET